MYFCISITKEQKNRYDFSSFLNKLMIIAVEALNVQYVYG